MIYGHCYCQGDDKAHHYDRTTNIHYDDVLRGSMRMREAFNCWRWSLQTPVTTDGRMKACNLLHERCQRPVNTDERISKCERREQRTVSTVGMTTSSWVTSGQTIYGITTHRANWLTGRLSEGHIIEWQWRTQSQWGAIPPQEINRRMQYNDLNNRQWDWKANVRLTTLVLNV